MTAMAKPLTPKERVLAKTRDFMWEYFPGPVCHECPHRRSADSDGRRWCWLLSGIGAEGMESECPAFKADAANRLKASNG